MSYEPSLKQRIKMALAEAGYPDAALIGPAEWPSVDLTMDDTPTDVMWQAYKIAGWTWNFLPAWAGREDVYVTISEELRSPNAR